MRMPQPPNGATKWKPRWATIPLNWPTGMTRDELDLAIERPAVEPRATRGESERQLKTHEYPLPVRRLKISNADRGNSGMVCLSELRPKRAVGQANFSLPRPSRPSMCWIAISLWPRRPAVHVEFRGWGP